MSKAWLAKYLLPYRVEWRSDLTCGWGRMCDVKGHDEARERADDYRAKYGGQTRVITQHVIEAKGLGDD